MKTNLLCSRSVDRLQQLSRISSFLLLLVLSFFQETVFSQAFVKPSDAIIKNLQSKQELRFNENMGQVSDMNTKKQRPDVLFTASIAGVQLFFHSTGIDYQFKREFIDSTKNKTALPGQPFQIDHIDSIQTYRLELRLAGANTHASITTEGGGKDVDNYYLAHCPQGILGVKNYQKIIYHDVYPGIDWVVYSKERTLKYDFVIHPGGNVDDIRLQYNGSTSLSIDEKGQAVITTPLGEVVEKKPHSYLDEVTVINSRFRMENNSFRFEIGKYDHSHDLIIDPGIIWSTFYGGSYLDNTASCSVDASGNVFLTGNTKSVDAIASGGFLNTLQGTNYDAFLVKFSADGSRQWGTYYGGTEDEGGECCVADGSGNVYMGGQTSSATGIASGGLQNTIGGNKDGFLVKFSPSGARLWATYYGGTAEDGINSCTIDINDNVYIAGPIFSTNGIAFNGFQNSFGGFRDAYIAKLSPAGTRLWASYYGDGYDENGTGCCTDNSGNVFLCGFTTSPSGLASGGFQNVNNGAGNAFLVKFSPTGSRIWATYYGGPNIEFAYACAADAAGNVFMTGVATSYMLVAYCGFQNIRGGTDDAFLVKFNSTGQRMWATYFGGENQETGLTLATDPQGNIYLGGVTYSSTNVAFNGFQPVLGGNTDAFLAKFTTTGTRIWSSYFGGTGGDRNDCTIISPTGEIYFTGTAGSGFSGFGQGGFQNTFGGWGDGYLAKVSNPDIAAPQITSFNISTPPCIAVTGSTVTITGVNFTGATSVFIDEWMPASFTVVDDNTIEAVLGTLGGVVNNGTITVTTPNGTATLCGISYCADYPRVFILANPGNNICGGTPVTFTAIAVNGGSSAVYQWIKNGVNVGTNSNTYTDNALNNGDIISCTFISTTSCLVTMCAPVISDTITMTVTDPGPAAVTIAASLTTICPGNNVDFTATPVNGGTTPTYQWRVNGINTGVTSNTYSSTTLVNGDIVTCILYSNGSCANPPNALSNAITITVLTPVIPSISINSSATTICAGASVSFTATPVNGGSTPAFQWQVNGINTGTNNAVFTSTTLVNGDIVRCILTNNVPCSSQGLVVSNNITMQVNAVVLPTITITASASNICPGAPVTFTAAISNGGTTPIYQWQLNGTNVGTNGNSYSSSILNNADVITCILTSNENCAAPVAVASNNINMIVENNLLVDAGGPLTVHAGSSVQALAVVTGSNTNLANILWTPSAGLSSTTVLNPVITPFVNSGTVEYDISITNEDGCIATDKLIVNILSNCISNVRNAFTPNGDGVNDTWKVYDDNSCLKKVSIQVFNRDGIKVFESADYHNDWQGRYKNKLLPDGTYYALVEFTPLVGEMTRIKTTLTILR
ncbi:MAG: gliding motility-associated C-terminal domain-containing protein [Ferruginibacter sp.]